MTETPQQPDELRQVSAKRKWASLIMFVLAALMIIVPFLFWRGTWFGRDLTEEETAQYLSDGDNPRHVQHALVQIAQRIDRKDATVKQWYPEVVHLAGNSHEEIRVMTAWVLGADPQAQEFHEALLGLVRDSEPMVRRNAALSLTRFGDATGRGELLEMLQPMTVKAPQDGTLKQRLKVGDGVDQWTLLARILTPAGETEVRATLPGTVDQWLLPDGTMVESGQEIFIVAPGEEHAWEALRALLIVGQLEDLQQIEQFLRGPGSAMSQRIQQQGQMTIQEIRGRAEQAEQQ